MCRPWASRCSITSRAKCSSRVPRARCWATWAKAFDWRRRGWCQVLDDAIQLHGALGYSEDLPFSQWYRSARAARIADGPDEVHQVAVARDWLLGRLELLV